MTKSELRGLLRELSDRPDPIAWDCLEGARYVVRVIADPEMTALGRILGITSGIDQADLIARRASGLPWGAAIVDMVDRTVDWGDRVTPLEGVPVLW